ncbi:MAG: glycosyltransferase family 4 protein, partial [Pseudomonadota bacterium]
TMSPAPALVQICPSDQPPFPALTRGLEQAAARLGCPGATLYLKASINPAGADPDARYLNLEAPQDYRRSGPALAAAIRDYLEAPAAPLVLAHRYRSYRVARAAGVPNQRTLVLAHEFGLLDRWQRRLDYRLHGRDVRFAGVSQPVADELGRWTGEASVLPNALDIDTARSSLELRSSARLALGIADRRFTVGVSGRLEAVKRPALALAGFKALDDPSGELLFIGDGSERRALEALADDSGARFTGFVEAPLRLLPGLDALLITTGAAEAFGLVALEALIAGVPVVSVPSPGVRYVTGDLGVFAADDSPAAIAAALSTVQGWSAAHRTDWAERALVRAREHFSLPALTNALAPHLR